MPTLPVWLDTAFALLVGGFWLVVLLVFATWLAAVIAAAAHGIRRLVRRSRKLREHADHVHRDWERWHAENDAPKEQSLSQRKRLKALGARTYRNGEEQ